MAKCNHSESVTVQYLELVFCFQPLISQIKCLNLLCRYCSRALLMILRCSFPRVGMYETWINVMIQSSGAYFEAAIHLTRFSLLIQLSAPGYYCDSLPCGIILLIDVVRSNLRIIACIAISFVSLLFLPQCGHCCSPTLHRVFTNALRRTRS